MGRQSYGSSISRVWELVFLISDLQDSPLWSHTPHGSEQSTSKRQRPRKSFSSHPSASKSTASEFRCLAEPSGARSTICVSLISYNLSGTAIGLPPAPFTGTSPGRFEGSPDWQSQTGRVWV